MFVANFWILSSGLSGKAILNVLTKSSTDIFPLGYLSIRRSKYSSTSCYIKENRNHHRKYKIFSIHLLIGKTCKFCEIVEVSCFYSLSRLSVSHVCL